MRDDSPRRAPVPDRSPTDHHRLHRPLVRPVVDRLHIVPVRIQQECRVVPGVIVPLARAAVVAAVGGGARLVEGVDRLPVLGLEGEVAWVIWPGVPSSTHSSSA